MDDHVAVVHQHPLLLAHPLDPPRRAAGGGRGRPVRSRRPACARGGGWGRRARRTARRWRGSRRRRARRCCGPASRRRRGPPAVATARASSVECVVSHRWSPSSWRIGRRRRTRCAWRASAGASVPSTATTSTPAIGCSSTVTSTWPSDDFTASAPAINVASATSSVVAPPGVAPLVATETTLPPIDRIVRDRAVGHVGVGEPGVGQLVVAERADDAERQPRPGRRHRARRDLAEHEHQPRPGRGATTSTPPGSGRPAPGRPAAPGCRRGPGQVAEQRRDGGVAGRAAVAEAGGVVATAAPSSSRRRRRDPVADRRGDGRPDRAGRRVLLGGRHVGITGGQHGGRRGGVHLARPGVGHDIAVGVGHVVGQVDRRASPTGASSSREPRRVDERDVLDAEAQGGGELAAAARPGPARRASGRAGSAVAARRRRWSRR